MRISSPGFRLAISGFTLVVFVLFAIAVAASLTGCGAIQPALNGYESAAASGLDAANDNAVKVWRYQVCATPVSAALRNPDIVPAIKALCMPAAGAAAASTLLDAPAKP